MKRFLASILILSVCSFGFVGCNGKKTDTKKDTTKTETEKKTETTTKP